MVIAYSAVGFILARLGQTFIVVCFTVDTKEASGTGTSVFVAYVLHIKSLIYIVARFQNRTWKVDLTLVLVYIYVTYKTRPSILAGCGGTFVDAHFTASASKVRVTGTDVAIMCVLRGRG